MTSTEKQGNFRWEHDLIGDEQVPADAYYGIQTMRAMQNFDISGVPISHFPNLIRALAMVKKAAALTNMELNHLTVEKGRAIVAACDEVIDGKLHDQFPVDLIQGGAGVSFFFFLQKWRMPFLLLNHFWMQPKLNIFLFAWKMADVDQYEY